MDRDVSIKGYLPHILQDIREYEAIDTAEVPEFVEAWELFEIDSDNMYIESSNEEGVARREKMLGITPMDTDTLDDRKFRLVSRYVERLPYTERILRARLEALCGKDGFTLNIDRANETVKVGVALTAAPNFVSVAELLEGIVPLNLVIDLIQLYNTHKKLHGYTHLHLHQFTHKELRTKIDLG